MGAAAPGPCRSVAVRHVPQRHGVGELRAAYQGLGTRLVRCLQGGGRAWARGGDARAGGAAGTFLLGASGAADKRTCRSRSSSSSSSWQAFFCVRSRAARRDAGTSLRAASGCREETEELGEREDGRGQVAWWGRWFPGGQGGHGSLMGGGVEQ